MKTLALFTLLALTGCASTRTYSQLEQCVHEPGCVSTFNSEAAGAPHAAAIAPESTSHWEPITKARKPAKHKDKP
jgi:hypothetical protein